LGTFWADQRESRPYRKKQNPQGADSGIEAVILRGRIAKELRGK
jgi:hypothetical protein